MRFYEYIFLATAFAASVCGCARNVSGDLPQDVIEPQFMNIIPEADGGYSLVSISPFDGSRDTISISQPLGRLIVTSTSYIGFLDAVGADSVIVGVSGGEYVCDSSVTADLSNGTVVDIGYDASPDYEKIMALKPDLLLTYSVSPVKSQFFSKLESLGIKTFIVNEHLERHPLARAAYIRLFGALTGNMAAADSVLKIVSENYISLRDSVQGGLGANDAYASDKGELNAGDEKQGSGGTEGNTPKTRKILVNIPYKDQWFIPGQESYLTTLFKDAGGEILGAKAGSSVSSQISVETAYSLSKEADLWMNVGWCQTLEQLLSVNPLFEDFLRNIQRNASAIGYSGTKGCATNSCDTSASVVWNDNNRLNPNGGNDFWESGVVRPDLLLRDLIGIFRGEYGYATIYYKSIK
uniref:ABC transporter substrate-binding protein n=1 Tax=Candidatus Cryptobacteroides bacterium TaxID=3085639 RepID=UPI004027618F